MSETTKVTPTDDLLEEKAKGQLLRLEAAIYDILLDVLNSGNMSFDDLNTKVLKGLSIPEFVVLQMEHYVGNANVERFVKEAVPIVQMHLQQAAAAMKEKETEAGADSEESTLSPAPSPSSAAKDSDSIG